MSRLAQARTCRGLQASSHHVALLAQIVLMNGGKGSPRVKVFVFHQVS